MSDGDRCGILSVEAVQQEKTTGGLYMKTFNIIASCDPQLHYMVDISRRLAVIRAMIDQGQYFTINRARQYGKTTTLQALERFLQDDYLVISLDFQMLSCADFENESVFVEAFSQELLDAIPDLDAVPDDIAVQLHAYAKNEGTSARLSQLFRCLSRWCRQSEQKIVLMIDEADNAADYQVFLDFLSQMRGYYIQRKKRAAFHSVILSSVYDIRNMKRKAESGDSDRVNSPWNIAVNFSEDMSFSPEDIAGMLCEYESDHHTGMDPDEIAKLIYDYTSGYPFLVSCLCKIMDELLPVMPEYEQTDNTWTVHGVREAVRLLLTEKNTLFESLTGRLLNEPELKSVLYELLCENSKRTGSDCQPDI